MVGKTVRAKTELREPRFEGIVSLYAPFSNAVLDDEFGGNRGIERGPRFARSAGL